MTREEHIAELEAAGTIVPGCLGCAEFYARPETEHFVPRHKPSKRCESGKRPHCTCDACF